MAKTSLNLDEDVTNDVNSEIHYHGYTSISELTNLLLKVWLKKPTKKDELEKCLKD